MQLAHKKVDRNDDQDLREHVNEENGLRECLPHPVSVCGIAERGKAGNHECAECRHDGQEYAVEKELSDSEFREDFLHEIQREVMRKEFRRNRNDGSVFTPRVRRGTGYFRTGEIFKKI